MPALFGGFGGLGLRLRVVGVEGLGLRADRGLEGFFEWLIEPSTRSS